MECLTKKMSKKLLAIIIVSLMMLSIMPFSSLEVEDSNTLSSTPSATTTEQIKSNIIATSI